MELADYLKLAYTIILRLDDEGDWVAEIEELEGCASHGETQGEALTRLEEAKELWIQEALSHGQPVPKPSATEPLPSGRWLQRVPRSLHKNLTRLAKVEGTSLNQLVTSVLADYVGGAKWQATTAVTYRLHGAIVGTSVRWLGQGNAIRMFEHAHAATSVSFGNSETIEGVVNG